MISLPPTRKRTAERRRLELSNPRYLARHNLIIKSVKGYEKYPDIILDDILKKPRQVRFFPYGLETITEVLSDGYTINLVIDKKRQVIEFYQLLNK